MKMKKEQRAQKTKAGSKTKMLFSRTSTKDAGCCFLTRE